MAHCPVCNLGVDDVDEHVKKEAEKGDESHKKAAEMGGHEGHNH